MNKKPYIIPSKTNNKNMERYLHRKLSEIGEGEGGGGSDSEAIKYTEQTLTAEQQTQARTNIGAGTYSKPSGGIPSSDLADKNKLDLIGTEVVNSVVDVRSGGGDLVGYKIIETYVNSFGRIVTREINLSDLYTRNGVTYVLQALTEQQKTQARYNIGAADAGALGGKKIWSGSAADYAQLTPSNDTIYFITP